MKKYSTAKRIMVLFLALAMLFGLVACKSNPSVDENKNVDNSVADNNNGNGTIEKVEDIYFDSVDDSVTVGIQAWKGGDLYTYTTSESGKLTKKTPEDTLIIGGTITYNALDPHFDDESVNVYETLLIKDTVTGEIKENLATAWEFDADGNLHLTLRENVKCHDGTILNGEDVLFSLHRASTSISCKAKDVLAKIDFDASHCEDDTHVVVVFKEPSGAIISWLTSPDTSIMSKEFVEAKGEDFSFLDASGGTGPYFLTETVTGLSQSYEAFPDYWQGEPSIKHIIYKRYEDTNTMLIDFENGELDYTFGHPLENLEYFVSGAMQDAVMVRVPSARIMFVNMCQIGDVSPFTDIRVRQALAYSINYEELVEAIGLPMADVALSCVNPTMDGYTELGMYEYNPEKAKELLAEAGYSKDNPCVAKMFTTQSNQKGITGEIIQSYANAVGFDIQFDIVKSALNTELSDTTVVPSEYQMRIVLNYPGSGDSFELFFNMLAGNGHKEGTYSAMRGIPNDDWCKAIDAADTTTDTQERLEQLALAQQIMHDEVLALPLFNMSQFHMYKPYVKGTTHLTGDTMYWYNWTIEQ